MKTRLKKHYIKAATVALVTLFLLITLNLQATTHDSFATCIEQSGAKFYGTFWCGHCKEQKRLFGNAAEKLPYVECSTPDGKEQREICTNANILAYPTWTFIDGSKIEGALSFEELSTKTGCVYTP